MRSQFITSIISVLLLAFSLCITELMDMPECDFEDEIIHENFNSEESTSDVLNPIYIFK